MACSRAHSQTNPAERVCPECGEPLLIDWVLGETWRIQSKLASGPGGDLYQVSEAHPEASTTRARKTLLKVLPPTADGSFDPERLEQFRREGTPRPGWPEPGPAAEYDERFPVYWRRLSGIDRKQLTGRIAQQSPADMQRMVALAAQLCDRLEARAAEAGTPRPFGVGEVFAHLFRRQFERPDDAAAEPSADELDAIVARLLVESPARPRAERPEAGQSIELEVTVVDGDAELPFRATVPLTTVLADLRRQVLKATPRPEGSPPRDPAASYRWELPSGARLPHELLPLFQVRQLAGAREASEPLQLCLRAG